ncbi:WD40/YVTN/BNR-like repeat-containing protein, partial [Umezakia ovalisporum]|uniref:WD40/YVTN/BNR-like repeat-containing protein n=1 Tax=Umezakia ovalisporum TaxID=75695 RepID=UPI0039C5FA9E
QIWESDTLPSFEISGRKRYSSMFFNWNFSNISFVKVIRVGPTNNLRTIHSSNFGSNYVPSRIGSGCILSLATSNIFNLTYYPIENDTNFIWFNIPALSNYTSFTSSFSGAPLGFNDSGFNCLSSFRPTRRISYNHPSIGNVPIDLTFFRSFYPINKNYALGCLKPSLQVSFVLGERDTVCMNGICRNGQPFIASQMETKFPILDYHFVNNNRLGFCAGYAGYIGKSIDLGFNWTKLNPPIKGEWDDVFFSDSLNGWVYGQFLYDSTDGVLKSYPIAIYTPDAGSTWFQIACDTNYVWKKKWFNSQGFGWALRDGKRSGTSQLVKTTDYGNSWSVQLSSLTERFEDMAFADTANGLIFSNFRNVSNNPPS